LVLVGKQKKKGKKIPSANFYNRLESELESDLNPGRSWGLLARGEFKPRAVFFVLLWFFFGFGREPIEKSSSNQSPPFVFCFCSLLAVCFLGLGKLAPVDDFLHRRCCWPEEIPTEIREPENPDSTNNRQNIHVSKLV